jgi:hypothetical protein
MSRWDTEVASTAAEDEARAISRKLTQAKITHVVARQTSGSEFIIEVQAADLAAAQLAIGTAGRAEP